MKQARISSYGLKIGSVVSQFVGLQIMMQAMHTKQLADVFVIMAAGSIAASCADFGAVRYSFRYFRRGVRPALIINSVIMATMPGALVMSLVLFAYAIISDINPFTMEIGLISYILGQFVSLNRYIALCTKRNDLAFLIESIQPLTFMACLFGLCVVMRAESWNVISTLLLSQATSLAIGTLLVREAHDWRTALHFPKNPAASDFLIGGRGWYKSLKRTAPVGLEALLATAWWNMLPTIANLTTNSFATASIGLFQRLLNVVRTFIGVSVTSSLYEMYDRQSSPRVIYKIVVSSMCLWISVSSIIFVCQPLLRSSILNFVGARPLEYVRSLAEFPVLIGLSCGLALSFQHLSFRALGLNLNYWRVTSVIAALIAASGSMVVGDILGRVAIENALSATILSTALASVILAFPVWRTLRQRRNP